MEYDLLIEELCAASNININVFNLDFDISNINGYGLVSSDVTRQYYYSRIDRFANINERWKSIVLIVPNGIINEFLGILNDIFIRYEKPTIDLGNIPDRIEYGNDDNSFNTLLILRNVGGFRVEFAKLNN